jgi:hypothetical protein
VILNLDYIADLIATATNGKAVVKGLADAGWMMSKRERERERTEKESLANNMQT